MGSPFVFVRDDDNAELAAARPCYFHEGEYPRTTLSLTTKKKQKQKITPRRICLSSFLFLDPATYFLIILPSTILMIRYEPPGLPLLIHTLMKAAVLRQELLEARTQQNDGTAFGHIQHLCSQAQ
jgi:hypothetical protein